MATLYGTNDRDVLYGTSVNDTIYGFAGDDLLDGKLGADSMWGGTGNDSYYVDSMADTISEFANQGTDTVFSSVSTNIQWLPSNVENLTLSGSATYGDGNNLNNVIRGTNNVNYLYGHDGHDTLQGVGGNDVLIGGNGSDILDGGFGSDSMFGGNGNDTYYLIYESYTVMSDNITEFSDQGTDTVIIISSVNETNSSLILPENVENLILNDRLGWVKGNSLNNHMMNNYASPFGTEMYGEDGNDKLVGNDKFDIQFGGNGDDLLDGGAGVDFLWGDSQSASTGNDSFILGFRGAVNADYIQDFSHEKDKILLDNDLDVGMIGAINPGIKGLSFTGGNNPGNVLNPAWYFEGSGLTGNNNQSQLSGIYVNTTNGDIWYNPTNNSTNATDAEIIGRVSASVATSLDYTDFVYGA